MFGVGVGVIVGVSVDVGSEVDEGGIVLVTVVTGEIVSVLTGKDGDGISLLCWMTVASGIQPAKSNMIIDVKIKYF
jgi:hypothetical protein